MLTEAAEIVVMGLTMVLAVSYFPFAAVLDDMVCVATILFSH